MYQIVARENGYFLFDFIDLPMNMAIAMIHAHSNVAKANEQYLKDLKRKGGK